MDTTIEETSSKSDGHPSKSLLREEAKKYHNDLTKRGIIYLTRIPPFMKPNKIRSIFEDHGEITRLYLAEEESEVRRKRKLAGGNGSKQFAEGWVEFADKSIAKQIADSFNNTSIGFKKGDFYHDDLWNIKYLHKFKWDYLTEKIAYERRVRENKLQLALMQSKKSNAEYVELVDKASAMKQVEARKRKRLESKDGGNGSGAGDKEESSKQSRIQMDALAARKKIKQNPVLAEQHGGKEAKVFDGKLLSNMFGKNNANSNSKNKK